jgi:hypothetical protein
VKVLGSLVCLSLTEHGDRFVIDGADRVRPLSVVPLRRSAASRPWTQ